MADELEVWTLPIVPNDILVKVVCGCCAKVGRVHSLHLKFGTDGSLCRWCLTNHHDRWGQPEFRRLRIIDDTVPMSDRYAAFDTTLNESLSSLTKAMNGKIGKDWADSDWVGGYRKAVHDMEEEIMKLLKGIKVDAK